MVYLIGRIEKIGGISGKRIYFKEVRGVAVAGVILFLRDGEKQESLDNFIYGSTHCFDCLVSLIEKALYLHNDNAFVVIQLKNDLVIEMLELNRKSLIKLAEQDKDRHIHFDNKLIENIVASLK